MTNVLINKTINNIKIADDKLALLFETNDGDFIVNVEGDCCSSSWIESVELPALGFPATVVSVENIEMPDLGQPDEYDYIQYYGCKIVTDKGEIVIDYRNESNGYYGGSLRWPDEKYYYGGVYAQNVSDEKWVDIEV